MIKLLQRKFVVTAMIAITVLIVGMLGAINVVNIMAVKTQIDNHLHMISENSSKPFDLLFKEHINGPRVNGEMRPRTDGDRIQASPFFAVTYDYNGNIVHMDSTRIPSLTSSDIQKYSEEVLLEDKSTGMIGNYRYLIENRATSKTYNIVFLDTSDEIYAYIRVLFFSIIIGFICWSSMLGFVIFLSKKAIRPIAESLEKQKQFITNAGHEIKTPIAIIQTNTEAMELYQGESKWSNNIKQQTARLGNLMKDLLQLSKMDESNVIIQKEEINLSNIISNQLCCFEELFYQNDITIEKALSNKEEFMLGNKEQITQLLAILFDNINKYAKTGSVARVSLERRNYHLKLIVENECDTLPTDDPERLFERFFRADKARTQKNGGYGIGLSLAKAIADANKYSLKCTYPTENTIRFTIIF